jgi:predicted N-acyltransferase
MNWQWTSIESILEISAEEYETLQSGAEHPSTKALQQQNSNPFLKYAFLSNLEASGSVGSESGWQTKHILIREQSPSNKLIAFLPAYIKTHSYGEYVFDHSWAHAYQQHGLNYYPKLSICIPFTPVTGPRLLYCGEYELTNIIDYLASQKSDIMETLEISSIHCLFSERQISQDFKRAGFHQRQSVQFNWYNKAYSTYADFTDSLTARRRRSIKKERASIAKQRVKVSRLVAKEISTNDMQFFYMCYQQTYLKRSGHHGYLNGEFFHGLLADMPDNLMLVIAKCDDSPVAAALFLYDKNGLYGRYWGALKEISGLHFEACYYQGIEFCIENKIDMFNPGTQGEHKILRGFEPRLCYSNHCMSEPAFDDAVKDFLQRETPHIVDYLEQSKELLPFKSQETAN